MLASPVPYRLEYETPRPAAVQIALGHWLIPAEPRAASRHPALLLDERVSGTVDVVETGDYYAALQVIIDERRI